MSEPKISVITVTFNAEKVLEKTIQSVINQTYPNIEYIIIDGASTDGTMDIVNKYRNRISTVVSEPDKGIYDAMNKGIKLATGDWINFMNAGDTFYSNDVLEKFIPKIESDTIIAYGDTMRFFSWGQQKLEVEPLPLIQKHMVFGHQATFIRSQYHKNNMFDISFKSSGDYNFFYNSYLSGAKFQYIPIFIVNYDAIYGISSNNMLKVKFEDAKVKGQNSILHKILIVFSCIYHYLKLNIKTMLLNFYVKHKKRSE